MGDFHISIRGRGAHHNKKFAKDANRIAAEAVQKLRDAGHDVKSASFTYGGEDDVADPAYLGKLDAEPPEVEG